MGSESIEASFLSIFALFSFFIFMVISKYSHKIKNGILFDQDFLKPQAFHQYPVSRGGGMAGVISFNIFLVFYINRSKYFIICSAIYMLIY